MDEYSVFKPPQHHYKMTNEWIDYAENVNSRASFKYPSNNNSLLINNNNNNNHNSNSYITNGNMHHQPSQQFYSSKMKPFNSNLNNNNNNSTLNQYNLMNKFLKPRGKCHTQAQRDF